MRCFISMILFMICVSFPKISNALCVKAEEANLRAGPGTQYQKTWTVFSNMPLKKLNKMGAWVHVEDVDGDKHWIHAPLITEETFCAVVKDALVKLHKEPSE